MFMRHDVLLVHKTKLLHTTNFLMPKIMQEKPTCKCEPKTVQEQLLLVFKTGFQFSNK